MEDVVELETQRQFEHECWLDCEKKLDALLLQNNRLRDALKASKIVNGMYPLPVVRKHNAAIDDALSDGAVS